MQKIKEFLKRYKVHIILSVIFIVSIISIYIQDKDRKESISQNSAKVSSDKIGVYISGEIKNEGIYFLKKDTRVSDVIDLAGGLTDMADISRINPAQKLNDSDKIIIPQKIENKENEEENDESVSYNENVSDKVNINTATKDELVSLNGIGEATANKIIDYRKNNVFKEIEDIMNVTGIGEAKFNNIKDYICV